MEAQVENGRRIGEPQGDTDGFTRTRDGLSEHRVLLIADVGNFVKHGPGGALSGEGGVGGWYDGGLEGAGRMNVRMAAAAGEELRMDRARA